MTLRDDKEKKVFQALRRRLGATAVRTDEQTLQRYQTATFATTQRVRAVVLPRSRSQVEWVVAFARTHRLALQPISRGRNHGYGCRVPASSGAVVLDLSRMARIGAYDAELGTIDLEPGVTFGQLTAFLARRKAPHAPAAIGGSPDGSVLGNALDRGIGLGRGGDRAGHTVGLEVVTGGGEVIHTGGAALPGSRTERLHRPGVGPDLTGLFFQSDLGIVTRATVWLEPLLPYRGYLSLLFKPAGLGRVVERLREALAEGALTGAFKITNDFARLVTSYPQWVKELPEHALLPYPMKTDGLWSLDLPIAGTRRDETLARMAWVRRRFAGCAVKTQVVPVTFIGREEQQGFSERDAMGYASLYWRFPNPFPRQFDLNRDRRGAAYHSPMVPLRGADMREAATLFERICKEATFEPLITYNVIDSRCAVLVGRVYWDRGEPGADARAARWHHRLERELADAGFVPYRLGLLQRERLTRLDPPTTRVVQALRRALDPDQVMAPGRYR